MIDGIFLMITAAILVAAFFYFKAPNKAQAEALYEKYEQWKSYCKANHCDIAKVYRVRQAAKNGTKAYVKWLTRDGTDAIWIKKQSIFNGQILVLRGNYGHGSHHNETVYYVNFFEVLPRKIIRGWKLHKATLETNAHSSNSPIQQNANTQKQREENHTNEFTQPSTSLISENETILKNLLSSIFSDSKLSLPLYCDFIHSEDDANNLQNILPLVYIWNEDKINHTFSVSINGSIVGSLLETILPRSNDNFNIIRDIALSVIKETSLSAIRNICEKAEAMPSVVFGVNPSQ
jgi:hypothetical protein